MDVFYVVSYIYIHMQIEQVLVKRAWNQEVIVKTNTKSIPLAGCSANLIIQYHKRKVKK